MTFATTLSKLSDAATQGEWYLLDTPWLERGMRTSILANSPDPHVAKFVCDFEFWADGEEDEEDRSWQDAELIALLANRRREILALVEAAKEYEAEINNPGVDVTMRKNRRERLFAALANLDRAQEGE